MSVGRFVDVESLGITWLTAEVEGSPRVLDKLPGNIEGQELIRVTRSPGGNDARSSLPRIDVECFAPTRVAMWLLAGKANDALARLSGHLVTFPVDDEGTTDTVQVDTVNTITDPVPGFWSPTVERSVAVYEFDLRV